MVRLERRLTTIFLITDVLRRIGGEKEKKKKKKEKKKKKKRK